MSLSFSSLLWDINCWEFGAARMVTWRTSLVLQWLRLFPVQGARVWLLLRELRKTCHVVQPKKKKRAKTWTLRLHPSDSGAHAPTLYFSHPFARSLLLRPSPGLPPAFLPDWGKAWPKRAATALHLSSRFPCFFMCYLSTMTPSATHTALSPSLSANSEVNKHSPVFLILQRKPSPVLFLHQATTSSFSFISLSGFLGQKDSMCPF